MILSDAQQKRILTDLLRKYCFDFEKIIHSVHKTIVL